MSKLTKSRDETDRPGHGPVVTITRVEGFRLNVTGAEAALLADVPRGDGGSGDAFGSVELLLAALGTCMTGTMLGFAKNEAIPVGEVSVRLQAVLADNPGRVERIEVTMTIPGAVTSRQLASLHRVAERCKIHTTLDRSPAIEFIIDVTKPEGGDEQHLGSAATFGYTGTREPADADP